MSKQKIKHKKGEKKICIEKVKKKNRKKKEIDIFNKAPNLIDILIPDFIDEKRDYIVIGDDKYIRSFVLAIYPSKTYLGWLDGVFSLLGDITLSIINRPTSEDSVIRQLNKKVTVISIANYSDTADITMNVGEKTYQIGANLAIDFPINAVIEKITLNSSAADTKIQLLVKGVENV